MICQTVSVIVLVLLLVIHCESAAVTLSSVGNRGENLIYNVDFTTMIPGLEELPEKKQERNLEERVDIVFNSSLFREIDQDILQVIGNNQSSVLLSCFSNKDNESHITWFYHGVGRKHNSLLHDDNDVELILPTLPPVFRMECVLLKDKSIRNNTLVYTGDGEPPYLHNHGESVKASVINETTASLPCLLNYHIDAVENLELQLFKDGNMVENKNNCLSYTPERGYFLNLTLLENPLGKYECRVANSTKEDVVFVELSKDNFIRIKYEGFRNNFFAGAPQKHPFQCILPKSMFEKRFEWFYLYDNHTYVPITDILANDTTNTSNSHHYMQTVKVKFPTGNITNIGCAGFVKGSPTNYSNSIPVEIINPEKPSILNGPPNENNTIIYTKGKNLTCAVLANPVTWKWLQNGEPISGGLNITEVYNSSPVRRSTITLDPSADDKESNYTCIASNYMGQANYSFRVQLPAPDPQPTVSRDLMVPLIVAAAVLVLFLGFLLIFFKVKVTRRTLDRKHIDDFIRGARAGRLPRYGQLKEYESVEEPAPYATISYDQSREIKYKSLIFERQLKAGNFGEVIAGRLLDTKNGTSIPVAIKQVKDDLRRKQDEIDDAFLNFLNEIKLMQYVGYHRNVVGYLGAVTSDIAKYSAYLVVEYCNGGDLDSFLKKNRQSFHDDVLGLHQNSNGVANHGPSTVLKTSHLLKWAEDIAAGLEYIASRRIVHMDVAARNVLLGYPGINSQEETDLDPGRLIARISDFGISRNLSDSRSEYYQILFNPEPKKNKPRQLPLRWMSIEALENLRFTTQSDVWALAVTYWEMFTLGELPFREVVTDDENARSQLINHIRAGTNMLAEPPYAHRDLCDIMLQCWDENPQNRPSLTTIRETLHKLNESENERIRRELRSKGEESPPVSESYQPVVPNYCQVAIMNDLNLAQSNHNSSSNNYYNDQYDCSMDDLECSMEYSDECDEDANCNTIEEAQSRL